MKIKLEIKKEIDDNFKKYYGELKSDELNIVFSKNEIPSFIDTDILAKDKIRDYIVKKIEEKLKFNEIRKIRYEILKNTDDFYIVKKVNGIYNILLNFIDNFIDEIEIKELK